jgi:hypothetical protein
MGNGVLWRHFLFRRAAEYQFELLRALFEGFTLTTYYDLINSDLILNLHLGKSRT